MVTKVFYSRKLSKNRNRTLMRNLKHIMILKSCKRTSHVKNCKFFLLYYLKIVQDKNLQFFTLWKRSCFLTYSDYQGFFNFFTALKFDLFGVSLRNLRTCSIYCLLEGNWPSGKRIQSSKDG